MKLSPTSKRSQKKVADFFHIRFADLKSKKRMQHIASAGRSRCTYAEDDRQFFSSDWGGFGRDHSTVIPAYNLVARRIANDSAFDFRSRRFERELKGDARQRA